MARHQDDRSTIRHYLLRELDDDQHQKVEQRLLTEDDLLEELEIAEDDLIEEYLAGQLTEDERARFEQHFLATPERRQKVRFAEAFRKYAVAHGSDDPKRVLRPPRPTYNWKEFLVASSWRVAVFAAVILIAALGVWRIYFHQSDVDKGLIALNSAYREQRPVEARITRFDYAPYVTTRGGETERVNSLERERAERYLLDAVRDHSDAASHHALGQFYLTNKEFDKAIPQFEEALKADPNNAQIYADLGAAFLEKGKIDLGKTSNDQTSSENGVGKGLEELAHSLENLNKALELDPNLHAALFNRALCYQYMMLPRQAEADWRKYLEKDSTSQWAEEARRNLKNLEVQHSPAESPQQILESFREAYRKSDEESAWKIASQSREIITGKMILFQLTRAYLAESSERKVTYESEALFSYLARLETERAHDNYSSDLLRYYLTISDNARQSLLEAQDHLNQGYSLCLTSRYGEAGETFARAKLEFSHAGDELEAELTNYWIAYCASQNDRIAESSALLDSLANYGRDRQYKWLESQALSLLANCFDLLGEHSRSITYNELALALAKGLDDTYNQQKILTQIGIQYTQMRRRERSLDFFYRSVRLSRMALSGARQEWRNATFLSESLYSLKLLDAAAAFEGEALRLASDKLTSPEFAHLSRVHLGMIYAALKHYDEADDQIEQSLRIAESFAGEASGQRMISYSILQLAHLKREAGDCKNALALYDRAVALYDQMEFDLDKYDTHKGRLLCYVNSNDNATFERELDYVLEVFEKYRKRILEEQNRNSFFDAEQSVYDIGIGYAFDRGDYPRAFSLSEASRGRSLLDSLRSEGRVSGSDQESDVVFSRVTKPLELNNIQAELPAGLQLVQYNLLPDRILIWTISRDHQDVVEKRIPAEVVSRQVSNYLRALVANNPDADDAIRRQAITLYNLLIAPIEPKILLAQYVCFIPDKALFYLPFASLISPVSGEYLVARHSVEFSPSASVFVVCSQRARKNSTKSDEYLLSIGNPWFDTDQHGDIARLPSAESEAREIAAFYARTTVLVGADALKETVAARMKRANVIHFACHYIADEYSPLRSKLLLAHSTKTPDDEDDALYASEVMTEGLTQSPLVVLSACQTAIEDYFNGEGMIGMARTFLAAGAPLVVASQWPIDSEATTHLMVSFHRHRKKDGMATVDALRRAQLDLLTGSNSEYRRPFYWAAFLAVGGQSSL